MRTIWQDLRYGARMLRRKPGFTLVAVITLALGIGANTAIFSVVNAVLLRSLPYKEPARLMTVWEAFLNAPGVQNPVAPSNFVDWRDQNTSFEEMVAYSTDAVSLTEAGGPEKAVAVYTSDNFLKLLGVAPLLGRAFAQGEITQPGEMKVIVISHALWQRQFGADSGVLGKEVKIDGNPVTIIGVMPPSFQFPSGDIDLWVATMMSPQVSGTRQAHYLSVLGRLKSGVTEQQAQADLEAIAARLREQYPESNRYIGATVIPLHENLVGDIRWPLLILLAATGFVLLIACANVANLLLARASVRHKEVAVRLALGAGRWRIIRQLLTESFLLSLVGGLAGLTLALWGVPFLVSLTPANIAQAKAASVDSKVLIFTFGVSLLTAVIFGLVPAMQATKLNLNEALKEGSRNTAGGGRGWVRNTLVIAEISIALVLLSGGGLLIRSFARLSNVDPGFRTDHLLTLEVSPPYSKYSETGQRAAFYDELLQRVESLPGVEAAGVVTSLPLKDDLGHMTYITEQSGAVKVVPALPRASSASYFRALGMPIMSGREFDAKDLPTSTGVAIINESMAQASWPGENPVGKRMKMGVETQPWLTVVGVVKDIRMRLGRMPTPQVYLPYTQSPAFGPRDLVLRTQTEPESLAAAVRREVWAIDKDQPVADISTMEQLLSTSIERPRFNMLLFAIFSALALALAGVGIYGVMSYTITQSTREIGIRMALGAQSSDVLKLAMGEGLRLTLTGVAIGLFAAFALTRVMSSLLFGVSATDPLTFALIALLLTAVALAACYVPARRATKIDPMVALRYE
ncbi:MAG: ABC transporter permease [Blastocatellia bacterium]